MGAFLEKPIVTKECGSGTGNGICYGFASMQGWRVAMEDAHTVALEASPNLKNCSFFAIFDGHAGKTCADISSVELLKIFSSSDAFKTSANETDVMSSLYRSFLQLDEHLKKTLAMEVTDDHSGCTAIVVFITPDNIFIGNCGDSRAVVVSNNKILFSSFDHKPTNAEENERIVNAGGSVIIQRVNGSLAVSRSLGDFDYKNVASLGPTQQLVSPEPDITKLCRDPKHDEFIILACDGIWDVLSNEECMLLIQQRQKVHADYSVICMELLDTCLAKGSRDNMSAILIGLENAVSVDPVVKEKDLQLEEKIIKHTREYLNESTEHKSVADVIDHIDWLGFPDYPPGGLYTKIYLIEKQYEEYASESDQNAAGGMTNSNS